jgi:hypothetical protein
VTFHDWAARATGTGQVHLVGSPLSAQACFRQYPLHVRLGGRRREGFDGVWDAYRQNPTRMQRLPHCRIVDTEVPCHGMHGEAMRCLDPGEGLVDFVNQRQDIAGITGIAHRRMRGKDEACRRFRDEARLAAKLDCTIALSLENRGNGCVVRIDNFTVPQPFAMDEPSRLCGNVIMGAQGLPQLRGHTLALGLTERLDTGQLHLGGLCQSDDRGPESEQARFRLAHQAQEDLALATTLATKAAHDLLEVFVEAVGMALERRRGC